MWIAGLITITIPNIIAPQAVAADLPVSFRTDVMPVISKAGCNMGTCHGNANGKAGFKLSLRGQDPDLDHTALTRDMFARRINPVEPDQSLILLKATTRVSHEGGLRFGPDSTEYDILRRWIDAGAVDDATRALRLIRLEVSPTHTNVMQQPFEVSLDVRAVFSNGEKRDVASTAVYEPSVTFLNISPDGRVQSDQPGEATVIVRYLDQQVPVRIAFVPDRPGFVWSRPEPSNYIDRHVFDKLESLRMNPSEVCTDTEFIRRSTLDLLGMLPTATEARRFVSDYTPNKRAQWVEEMFQRPEFADYWALKWSDLLRNEEKSLDRKGVQSFHRWIRNSIAANKPLDRFVHELISSRGSTYENPPANYFRALRTPIDRAEATAQLFLGTRLQCAKCHNHPFDRWTQADYYDWANVFSRVQYKILANQRRDNLDKHEFVGEQIVWMAREGSVTNPKTGRAAASRFLDMSDMLDPADGSDSTGKPDPSGEPDVSEGADPLEAMADWLTSPDNPLFARTQVNRIWFHLMGRGIVDPIDDFRLTNPPGNPELLDALTRDFVASGFDMRHLIRVVMRSRTYQASSVPNDSNREDAANYSHAIVRRLTAEQLLDAQCQVAGVSPKFNGYPAGFRAGELPGVEAARKRDGSPGNGDMFLRLFGKPERLLTCECERSDETTMGQAFQLISGPAINGWLLQENNRLDQLLNSGIDNSALIEELYWTALSRAPNPTETQHALALLDAASPRRIGVEDLAWALMNAKAFVLRH